MVLSLSPSAHCAENLLDSERRLAQAKKIVVMINGKMKDVPCFGSGIAFGWGVGRLYIATARHVVRKDPDDTGDSSRIDATDITVEFSLMPGEKFSAKLLGDYRDSKENDLAVLAVPNVDSLGLKKEFFPFAIIDESPDFTFGDNLHSIAQPNGQRWTLNAMPYKYKDEHTSDYEFEVSALPPGVSGGALFTTELKLVGMIKRKNVSDGVALRIDRMIEILKSWGYPVHLSKWQVKDALGITNINIVKPPQNSKFFRFDGLSFKVCDSCEDTAVFCDRWVHDIESLDGKRVRTYPLKDAPDKDFLNELVQAAGGKPMQVPYSELYVALQTGVVNCVMISQPFVDRLP
jgi:hypothetical protein